MRIIPAIDLIEGKCVRLEEGDYDRKKVYNEDPLEVAKSFEAHGIQYLHLVDLDGAKAGKVINWRILEKIASQTSLTVDFGGGVKSDEDLKICFESGAAQVNVGSTAVKQRELFLSWLEAQGPDRMILSADAKDRKIAVSGWQEGTDLALDSFIGEYLEAGIRYVVCTDIAKDGMLQGPSTELYGELTDQFETLKLVASGGITTMADVEALAELKLEGAIIGKAIYEGRISLPELEQWQLANT
ncbi:1-(5-phosphoribosyl)-5-[(5-phosphoribosylamino)methylideneamino]imidazole-4-carboxamide isomerase [Pontibacter sp. G13]|uniref:1-(5-phosphoribosyl)-5-[(5- phosphoribosylamino)methylideneamino]imidazole-4- carboxamide isomerase n=1 Tax=Pontibacter sp. G13 TaxID=3074898 RepID=UPI002889A00D|nr:1-(5-phosphoribosyl)-5-[(5-phosphoribosylamino)methylideneamino]imidazole-4-carboxamide isomerase [Pontibacter sp. G13]WNJ18727.1 1-(5-phosphoribosyl)-5-[(5-phosphoribosylamino)methylideneamino]imidazole-4-carboxamide isomerase [Pontibacter sp. G13]